MSVQKGTSKMIREMVKAHPSEVVDALLEEMFWPEGLAREAFHQRRSDDTDGLDSYIRVMTSGDMDAWIEVVSHFDPEAFSLTHRFRTPFHGGGMSPRTRNALLILARAIQLDNAQNPQPPITK